MVRVFRSNQFQGRKVQETTHFAAVGGAAAGALEGLEPSAQGLLGVSLPTPKALTMRAWSASRKKKSPASSSICFDALQSLQIAMSLGGLRVLRYACTGLVVPIIIT